MGGGKWWSKCNILGRIKKFKMLILFKVIKISQGYMRPGKESPRNIDLIIYPTTSLAEGSIISQDTSLRVVPMVHERGIV